MNTEVNLTKRVKTPEGLRYCPVVISANGRIRPDAVIVNGKEEKHPEGAYYLDWREGAKRVRLSVGKDAADANNQREKKEAELNAKSKGLEIAPANGQSSGPSLAGAISEYLEEVELAKKPKTYQAYTTALEYFQESCHKLTLADLDRKDMLKFAAFLRDEKEQSPRSTWNKFANVMSFLKAQGVRRIGDGILGVQKNDWPRFTEEEPEIYEREELDTLFASCSSQEKLWFEYFLMTGEREQEVMYTTWDDVNTSRHVVTVKHKPQYGWEPKAYKEREIPIPSKLSAALKAAKKNAGDCALVFPTSGCKPKFDFLDCLKAVAERAGLNPEKFWLHKFRATFATWSLWAGVDLRTVQTWLGHSDMESTMRYLKPSRSEATRDKVNTIFA